MSAAHVICVSAYPENHKMESMKMIAIFTGLLFLSLSYLFQVNCNNDCDCYNDVVSRPFDEVIVTICPDATRVRSLEFRLSIDRHECDAILHIYTQELTDMEIYMNNLYKCPSGEHTERHCVPTICSVGLSYPSYSPIEAETPGNITLQTSDLFDFFFRNITMILGCAAGGDDSYNETFEVVFRRNLTKTVTSASIIVPQTTSYDAYVSDSSKDTPANMIQTSPGAIEKQKQATHTSFFDDYVNVALVSAVSVVGFLGSMTVILYYLGRRLCTSVTVFPGPGLNDEETNNDMPTGHLGQT